MLESLSWLVHLLVFHVHMVFVICSSPNAAGVNSVEFRCNLFNTTCCRRPREDQTLVQYFTANCLFYSIVNNSQVGAGVKLLDCALEIFAGKADMPRKQRVCRCNAFCHLTACCCTSNTWWCFSASQATLMAHGHWQQKYLTFGCCCAKSQDKPFFVWWEAHQLLCSHI